MKHKLHDYSSTAESFDGPPVDFSFKNIRTLMEIEGVSNVSINQLNSIEKKQQIKKPLIFHHNSMENQTNKETVEETKLNIVRTIEIMDNRILEATKNGMNKKVEQEEKKIGKKIQVLSSSLFLKYNKLVSIEGLFQTIQVVFPNYTNLQWIDLSHNRLVSLVEDFERCPNLKNLYLHANFIPSFKEFQKLQKVKLLRTFTVHGNPIENYPEFRVLLSCMLPQLQKIDSTLLTKRQRERGQILVKQQNKKYPVIQNPQKPPHESDEEEGN